MAADPIRDPALVDAVARRVLEVLDEEAARPSGELLTVARALLGIACGLTGSTCTSASSA